MEVYRRSKEVKFFYQDNSLIDNYYLEEYNSSFTILPEYDVIDDSFFKKSNVWIVQMKT